MSTSGRFAAVAAKAEIRADPLAYRAEETEDPLRSRPRGGNVDEQEENRGADRGGRAVASRVPGGAGRRHRCAGARWLRRRLELRSRERSAAEPRGLGHR